MSDDTASLGPPRRRGFHAMRSTAKIALTSLVIAMIGAIAATTAQANEGPFYEEGGIRLEEGEKLEQTEAAKTSLVILAKAGQAISCTGAPFASGATLNGSTGKTASTSTETIEYTGCKVTGNGASCKVEGEKIKTSALKTTMGYATEKREKPLLEVVEPASGTTIAEPKFTGTCTTNLTKISGAVVGEAVEPEKDTTEREMKFTKAERTIWTENTGTLTSHKPLLEAFSTTATEETTDEIETKQAVVLGVTLSTFPTSLCESEPVLGKCAAGTYYPTGSEFSVESANEFEITGGGNTIKCEKSSFVLKTGLNAREEAIKTEIKEPKFEGCKTATKTCTLTAPMTFHAPLPWDGKLEWRTTGLEGPNGSLTNETVSIRAVCETEECSYVGWRPNETLPGYIYNPGDSNTPVVPSPWAEIEYRTLMKSGVGCSGNVQARGVYNVIPPGMSENTYVGNS
jgi:hypothetical protein